LATIGSLTPIGTVLMTFQAAIQGRSLKMSLHAQCVPRSVTLLCLLAIVCGCTQNGPPQVASIPSTTSETAEKTVTVEQPVAVDPNVHPATAETRIPSVAESAAKSDQPEPPAETASPAPARLTNVKAIVPFGEVADAELKMPQVSLTQAHADACRVKVGDPFPESELKDTAGQAQPLASLRGQKMTVIVFWNGTKANSREELADLEPAILARFGASGVGIVGVNSGDNPQLVGELAKQSGASFPVLCDPEQALLEQVAPGKVPATYLLDATGTVLWFDIEYSRSTRRELAEAIRYTLAHP
jgi:peroxiredoxin